MSIVENSSTCSRRSVWVPIFQCYIQAHAGRCCKHRRQKNTQDLSVKSMLGTLIQNPTQETPFIHPSDSYEAPAIEAQAITKIMVLISLYNVKGFLK